MKRFPLIPTILVAAAVATMIALGFWQLRRAGEKDALAERYLANRALPAMALQTAGPVDESQLYRRASAFCLEVVEWRQEAM
jgi:cytochrome oxidase assembly protein ShyY1